MNAVLKQSYKEKILWAAAFFLTGTGVLFVLYLNMSCEIVLPFVITFGTTAYHFVMRLLVGLVFSSIMQNRADYGKQWYHVGKTEMTIYRKLNVKKWKGRLPTYDRTLFDPRIHTWEELAQAACQAELIHETIVILSFLPVAAGRWFGAYPVFIVTSVLAAAFDLGLVMTQRYNRQRILKMLRYKRISGRI